MNWMDRINRTDEYEGLRKRILDAANTEIRIHRTSGSGNVQLARFADWIRNEIIETLKPRCWDCRYFLDEWQQCYMLGCHVPEDGRCERYTGR